MSKHHQEHVLYTTSFRRRCRRRPRHRPPHRPPPPHHHHPHSMATKQGILYTRFTDKPISPFFAG